MSSRTRPPSGGTANAVGSIVAPEDVRASFVPWPAAVGPCVFETIDSHAPRGIMEAR
jgi:hypothetical protein